jgi:hypothetical protein
VELGEKLPEPGGLSHAVSDSAVLRLGTGAATRTSGKRKGP